MKNKITKKITLTLIAIIMIGTASCGGGEDDWNESYYDESEDFYCYSDDECGGAYNCRRCMATYCTTSYTHPSCNYAIKELDNDIELPEEGAVLDRCTDNNDCAEGETCDEFGLCASFLPNE